MSQLMTTIPGMAKPDLLERINQMRAEIGLPPLPPDVATSVLGIAPRSAAPQPTPGATPAATAAPTRQPGIQQPPAAQMPQRAVSAPPGVNDMRRTGPTDPMAQVAMAIAQFFSPGAKEPDLTRIPAVSTTYGGVSDKPFTQTGGGLFTPRVPLGVNPPPTGKELAGVPRGTPRDVYTVAVGNLEIGRFPTEEEANVVRDRLRAAFRQGPAPSVPTLAIGGAFNAVPKNMALEPAPGTIGVRVPKGEAGAAPSAPSPVSRPAANPNEARLLNTIQGMFGRPGARGLPANIGPTIPEAELDDALEEARRTGLLPFATYVAAKYRGKVGSPAEVDAQMREAKTGPERLWIAQGLLDLGTKLLGEKGKQRQAAKEEAQIADTVARTQERKDRTTISGLRLLKDVTDLQRKVQKDADDQENDQARLEIDWAKVKTREGERIDKQQKAMIDFDVKAVDDFTKKLGDAYKAWTKSQTVRVTDRESLTSEGNRVNLQSISRTATTRPATTQPSTGQSEPDLDAVRISSLMKSIIAVYAANNGLPVSFTGESPDELYSIGLELAAAHRSKIRSQVGRINLGL